MVSRRAGLTFSDLACGTGVQHIRIVPARMCAVFGHGWGELPESGAQLWLCRPRNEHLGRAPSWIPLQGQRLFPAGPAAVISEIGVTVREFFPGDAHLASWTGLCPGNHESAGRRGSGKRRTGNEHLQSILVECAWSAVRHDGYRTSGFAVSAGRPERDPRTPRPGRCTGLAPARRADPVEGNGPGPACRLTVEAAVNL